MATVQFNTKDHPFFDSLRKKVDKYFEDNNLKYTGNWRIYLKTAILLSTAATFYTILVFFTPSLGISLVLCGLLGINLAAIGFNVMHDGAHGAYSSKEWLNNMMGYTLNLMGGDVQLWKIKHNLIHHSFTNIEGLDDDINIQPLLRTHEDQKWYSWHRFQHIYAMFLYGLTYLMWVTRDDFQKYFRGKIGETSFRSFTPKQHFIFWISKIGYFSIFVIFPMFFVGVLQTLLGFLTMTVVCGILIAIVFQLAHVVEETEFSNAKNTTGFVEDEWAVHQIKTTSNFATRSRVVSWFTGGLNFQVEHHLFPRISHIHYPAVNKIVKETCAQFGIDYKEHKTVFGAVKSHFMHLKEVGNPASIAA